MGETSEGSTIQMLYAVSQICSPRYYINNEFRGTDQYDI